MSLADALPGNDLHCSAFEDAAARCIADAMMTALELEG